MSFYDDDDPIDKVYSHRSIVELDVDHILDLTCKKASPETRLFYAVILQAAQDIKEFPEDVLKYVEGKLFEKHCNRVGLSYIKYKKLFLKEIKKVRKNVQNKKI